MSLLPPRRTALLLLGLSFVQACATAGGVQANSPASSASPAAATSPPAAGTVQAQGGRGAGSLRQDAISLRFQFRGVLARMFPMDESVISLLAPDSYRALTDLLKAQNDRIQRARTFSGNERFSIWYVSYHALEPDARFSPSELVIRAAGRDFRPIDVIPLSAGFSQQRIQQGQSQTALYLFDSAIDLTQPLEASMEDVRNAEWAAILRQLERERSRVRSATTDTVELRSRAPAASR